MLIKISQEVQNAIKNNIPVVALESTIISHGMPYPKNVETALNVEKIIRETLSKVTKQEILEQCPDISETTVQRALNDLLKKGKIIKISGGRYTSYTWNRED